MSSCLRKSVRYSRDGTCSFLARVSQESLSLADGIYPVSSTENSTLEINTFVRLTWILCSPLSAPPLLACSLSKIDTFRGAWVARSVKRLTLAQVTISRSVSSSPASGSVLTAQSLEPALDSVSHSLSAPPPCYLSLSLKNK